MSNPLARKFLVGDIVKHKDSSYKLQWVNYDNNQCGIIKSETAYGATAGKVVDISEIELIEPTIHKQRPLKPVSEMSTDELREHVRLLREGRQESIINMRREKKKRKTKSKSKKKSKTQKLKEKYPDLPDKAIKMMMKQGEETACELLGIEMKGD